MSHRVRPRPGRGDDPRPSAVARPVLWDAHTDAVNIVERTTSQIRDPDAIPDALILNGGIADASSGAST